MAKMINEYVQLREKLRHLELDYAAQSRQHDALNQRMNELISENTRLSAMLSEKYEIVPDLARANLKLYQQKLRIRAMKAAIKDLKEKLAHKLTDGEVIELIRAYANKKEEIEVLKQLIERIKYGTD